MSSVLQTHFLHQIGRRCALSLQEAISDLRNHGTTCIDELRYGHSRRAYEVLRMPIMSLCTPRKYFGLPCADSSIDRRVRSSAKNIAQF